jgi:predicted ester cyclase
LIQKVIDATNNRDLQALESCYAEIFTYYAGSDPEPMRTGIKAIYENGIGTMPDLKAKLEHVVVQRDMAAVRMIVEGTDARYNEKIKTVHHWFARIEDDRIVELWDVGDRLGALRQLGFTVSPPTQKQE